MNDYAFCQCLFLLTIKLSGNVRGQCERDRGHRPRLQRLSAQEQGHRVHLAGGLNCINYQVLPNLYWMFVCFNFPPVSWARYEDGRLGDAAQGGARRLHSHHLQVRNYKKNPTLLTNCPNFDHLNMHLTDSIKKLTDLKKQDYFTAAVRKWYCTLFIHCFLSTFVDFFF